jgi:hypothetical protein
MMLTIQVSSTMWCSYDIALISSCYDNDDDDDDDDHNHDHDHDVELNVLSLSYYE